MGRKKKSNIEVELENEMPVEEAVAEESSESEWEAEEAESLATDSDEKEPAAMDAEESEEKAAAKPKRQRRSRKKAPEVVEAAESEEEPTDLEAQPEEPAEEEVAPKKAARGKKKNEESDISPVFQQWKTLQEITASMAANFERIHRQMNDLQGNYLETAERLAKQAPSKPPVMTKVSMGVAMFSVVISLLSLSFAQSVRNSIVEKTPGTPRVAQSTPGTSSSDAPSLAMGNDDSTRKSLAGSRKRSFPKPKK